MKFLEEKLNDSLTRDFVVRDPFSGGGETRVVTLSKEDIEVIFTGFKPLKLDYYAFADIRRILKKELAQYLQGEVVHVSKVNNVVWENYTKDMGHKVKQKGYTYRKVKKDVKKSGDS